MWDVIVVPIRATDPADLALFDGETTTPLPTLANDGSGDPRNDASHALEGR